MVELSFHGSAFFAATLKDVHIAVAVALDCAHIRHWLTAAAAVLAVELSCPVAMRWLTQGRGDFGIFASYLAFFPGQGNVVVIVLRLDNHFYCFRRELAHHCVFCYADKPRHSVIDLFVA